MDKKRSPNRLIVDEATNDDNSVSLASAFALRTLRLDALNRHHLTARVITNFFPLHHKL
jgi:hypothetical protein